MTLRRLARTPSPPSTASISRGDAELVEAIAHDIYLDWSRGTVADHWDSPAIATHRAGFVREATTAIRTVTAALTAKTEPK